jgi:DNA-binding NarL/FixJ family response regulator
VQMSSKASVPHPHQPRARVVIADDHLLVAQACKRLLEPEFEVVGIVSNGRELMHAVEKLRPNVAILDIGMPHLNGLDAGAQLRRKNTAVKLIYLTMNTSPSVATEAFRRGASGYLLKQSSAEELPLAVRRVLGGESYLSPAITKDTVEFLLATWTETDPKLSGRQAEILQLLAEGYSMKEIAHILVLKPGTVAFHKYRLMEALRVRTMAGLIDYAVKHHMTGATGEWKDQSDSKQVEAIEYGG